MLKVFEGNHVEVAAHEPDMFHMLALVGHNFVGNPRLKMLEERASIGEVVDHCIFKR